MNQLRNRSFCTCMFLILKRFCNRLLRCRIDQKWQGLYFENGNRFKFSEFGPVQFNTAHSIVRTLSINAVIQLFSIRCCPDQYGRLHNFAYDNLTQEWFTGRALSRQDIYVLASFSIRLASPCFTWVFWVAALKRPSQLNEKTCNAKSDLDQLPVCSFL